MSSIELNDVTSGYNLGKINANFTEIERVINDELLHRVNNGTSVPNTLEVDIDANGQRIYNLPSPITGGEPLRLKDLFGDISELLSGPRVQKFTATQDQTVFVLSTTYVPGSGSVYVIHNGLFLTPVTEFQETNANTITLLVPVDAGDEILVIPIAVSGSGEGSSDVIGSNIGTGVGIYKQKIGNALNFKTIKAGNNISVVSGDSEVTINGTAANVTVSNVGAGNGVYKQKVGDNVELKTLVAGNNISIASSPNELTISGVAANVTGANLGASGEGVYSSKNVDTLQFRKLVAGTNVTLTGDTNTITISSTGGGGPSPTAAKKIVVLGDSYTAQQPMLSTSWPVLLEDYLKSSGEDVEVFNLGINGWTYNKANVTAAFGAGRTMRQAAIDMEPDVVIVALGHNDATFNVEGRTISQVRDDALAFYTAIRTALPSAVIVYASQLTYDKTHGIPSTLVNQQVIPFLMQQRSTGILANTYCAEILTEPVSSTTRANYGNWENLDVYVKALTQINTSFTLPIWKAARMGMIGYDSVHCTKEGNIFLAASARKAFKTLTPLQTAFPNLSNQSYPSFDDPDYIFSLFLTDTGTQFNDILSMNFEGNHPIAHFGPFRAATPVVWFLPSKGTFKSSSLTHVSGNAFTWMMLGMPPLTPLQVSFNGGAWTELGYTDAKGNYIDSGILTLAAGSYTFRYKVGNEVQGPLVVTVTAGTTGQKPAIGRYWGVQGNYLNTTNGFTEVFYNTTPDLLANGMAANTGSISVGPSFIVPRNGIYRITGAAMNTSNGTGTTSFLRATVFKTGIGDIDISDGSTAYGPTAGFAMNQTINTVVNLAAGDRVRLRTFSAGSTTQQNNSTNTSNYFCVEELNQY